MNLDDAQAKLKVKAIDKMNEIIKTLSSIDGIATGDALRLGMLIQEYGQAVAGEAIGDIMKAMLGNLGPDGKKEPWQK